MKVAQTLNASLQANSSCSNWPRRTVQWWHSCMHCLNVKSTRLLAWQRTDLASHFSRVSVACSAGCSFENAILICAHGTTILTNFEPSELVAEGIFCAHRDDTNYIKLTTLKKLNNIIIIAITLWILAKYWALQWLHSNIKILAKHWHRFIAFSLYYRNCTCSKSTLKEGQDNQSKDYGTFSHKDTLL